MRKDNIRYIDLFSGIGGFREGLTRAGGFACAGHCEIDKFADKSYRALFDTEGEWFCSDIKKADPDEIPEFDLLCAGFPCQPFSIAGNLGGFSDPRGSLFFEIARLAQARKPAYLLLENVPNLLSHDGGRTFASILHALDRLGYGLEWQVLNSSDFSVPQSRKRLYLIGYLDERCRGKVFPFTETAGTSLKQIRSGSQGERVYSCEGVSCTLSSEAGGFGGRTGLYEVSQDNLCCVDMNEKPEFTSYARCVMAKQNGGIRKRRREASGVWDGKRIRRLTPRECLRLQGWTDDRIDRIVSLQSDSQIYKQAGNGVTVHVVEAIGRRLAAVHREVMEGSI